MKKLSLTLIIILTAISISSAQEAPAEAVNTFKISEIMTDPLNYLIVFTTVILLGTILVMARTIKLLTWQIAGRPAAKEKIVAPQNAKKSVAFLDRLSKKLNDAVPVEQESDVLLDHDYDGIKELDNNLPPWWKYGFYLTIVVAVIYMVHYHVAGSGNVQLDEYNAQLAEAEIQKQERLKLSAGNVDESNVTTLVEETDIAAGLKTFQEKCLVCHGKAGEGLVGPNLTDDYWLHGGDIKDVFKIIKYGFPSKGMLAWQGQLTPIQIQQVASYVKSIKGSNPANPKEPQGDLFQESASSSVDSIQIKIAADSVQTTASL